MLLSMLFLVCKFASRHACGYVDQTLKEALVLGYFIGILLNICSHFPFSIRPQDERKTPW